jgi:type II secretory pathway component PulM
MTAAFASTTRIWTGLAPRERLLIGILAALATVAFAWYLVAVPGWTAARSAESRLRSAEAEQLEVQSLAADLKAQQAIAQSTDAVTAMETIRSLAAAHGLSVTSLSETGNGALSAELSGTSSRQALTWASAVSRRTAMRTASLTISPSGESNLAISAQFARTLE